MKFKNNNQIVFIFLLLAFIAGVVAIFMTDSSHGGGDNFAHYKFAHWGWKYPELLFNHWGKPVFTIIMSPFAQFGIVGARIFSLFMGLSTAFVIWKLALQLNFKNSFIAMLLVLFTPIYFILMFSTLTEISFSFFLALAVLLFFKKKYLFSAIVVSFLPLVRTEGIVLFPLFMLAYSFKRQFLAIPLLSTGFWIITLFGLPYYDSFWWLITDMPYSGNAKEFYGTGSLYRFVNDTRGILGYPIWILFIIGLLVSIFRWGKIDRYNFSDTFYFLLLIPGSYFVFLSAHSFAWWQGIGNSLGLIRVIASVTPFVALTALLGFNWLYTLLKSKNSLVANLTAVVLLGWIIILGIVTHINSFNNTRQKQLAGQAADFLQENKLDKHKIFYYNSYLIIKLGLDPFDESKSSVGVANRQQPAMSMPDNSILVWDAHFGPNEGGLPLSRLKNSNEFTLLKIIRPTHPFKVLGGYDYAIYIFQKIPKTNEGATANISSSLKEYIFDFEESENNSVSYFSSRSLLITSEKEYFPLINHNVLEFPNSSSSLKIDFSASVFCEDELCKKDIILVCTLKTNGKAEAYQAVNLFDLVENSNGWSEIQYTFNINDIPSMEGNLKLYLWNKSKTTFNIDEVKIEITTFDSQTE